ncbi:hypothetical protein tinsulaeT_06040 [Thalassotalea insulae]|uniref:AB hydrolase-1 domain-containing protein n=1 Tax=Thalassotalea insulae TaxID=2056778 RepID=A0ABQ6GNX9_9GAMM|nr:alpha/beta hydrolase [Thalassotalea insulae]GLX77264.1 hypothetical protein tinsulaeT_06040 [Thalassotalea insulae]
MGGVTIQGQGPAVVLLHSSLSSSKQWQSLVEKLAVNFTCINIDLLGYGRAPTVSESSEYNFSTEVIRIKQILAKENISAPYHLIGHSCGGAIALKMAQENSDDLFSLTLYEPVAFHLLEQQHQHAVKFFADSIKQENNIDAAKHFVNYWNGNGYFDNLPASVQQQMAKGMDKVNLDFNGIFAESYTLADLADISCPSLLMLGQYTTADSKQLSEAIAKAIAQCQLTQIAAGHMGPLSHPQLVEPVIVDFLAKQS